VGPQDARHREVILRGLHERAADGKRGHIHRLTPNPKARPRLAGPFGWFQARPSIVLPTWQTRHTLAELWKPSL
jgi:hypothetical protein